MVAQSYTVAFEGVEARLVEVQCALSPGMPHFSLVGLPDKAVSEAKERVRAALNALSIALPSRRITVNLSPADLPKEGSHFDLPIALALLAAIEILPKDTVAGLVSLGELALDGALIPVTPDLSPEEALETSTIHSLSGLIEQGGISRRRPFRAPHHTASMAAIVGGGKSAKPGEISLAHNGVLFMDEFPEYARGVLETLRQPIETGDVTVARANAHVKYPCRFLLVAAANPCKCGYLADAARACARVPGCGADYLGRISGPLMDRFDLRVEVPPVSFQDLDLPASGAPSAVIAARVEAARQIQRARFADHADVTVNADAGGGLLERVAKPDEAGQALLTHAAEQVGLSARGYHRVIRVARTIADLAGRDVVGRADIAEAISFRVSGIGYG